MKTKLAILIFAMANVGLIFGMETESQTVLTTPNLNLNLDSESIEHEPILNKYMTKVEGLTLFAPVCNISKNPEALAELVKYAIETKNAIFLKQICNLNKSDKTEAKISPNSLLIMATKASKIDLMEKALKAGAKIDFQDGDGNTALHHAVKIAKETKDTSAMKYLLEKGANPNIENYFGQRTLHLATGILPN